MQPPEKSLTFVSSQYMSLTDCPEKTSTFISFRDTWFWYSQMLNILSFFRVFMFNISLFYSWKLIIIIKRYNFVYVIESVVDSSSNCIRMSSFLLEWIQLKSESAEIFVIGTFSATRAGWKIWTFCMESNITRTWGEFFFGRGEGARSEHIFSMLLFSLPIRMYILQLYLKL